MVSNVIFSILYQACTMLSSFITTPYLARVLGARGMGEFVVADTYAQYIILLGGIGLNIYAAREIGYVRDDKAQLKSAFWGLAVLRLISFMVSIAIYCTIFFVGNLRDGILMKIALVNIIASMFDISWYFIGVEKFKEMSIRNAVIKIIAVFAVFIFVKREEQVWIYAFIMYSANFLGQIIMWLGIPKSFLKNIKISSGILKKYFKGTLTIFASTIMIQVYTLLDRVMLGEISGEVSAAYYDNAQKLIKAITFSLTAGIQALLPAMANDFINSNMEEFKKKAYKTFKYVASFSMPFCFGLISISGIFSEWFYGNNFEGIDILLILGAPVIVSIGWSSILAYNVLVVADKQKYLNLAVGVGAFIDVIINILFIPKYGAIAATISTIAAEISGLIIMFFFSKEIISVLEVIKGSIKYFLLSVFMAAVVSKLGNFLSSSILSTIFQVGVGAFTYLSLLIITRDAIIKELYILIKRKLV